MAKREGKPTDCIKEIVQNAFAWLGFSSAEEFEKEDKASRLLNGALAEVYGIYDATEQPDIEKIISDAKEYNSTAAEALGRDSCLTRHIIYCSTSGILPFYLTKIAAYGMMYFERKDRSIDILIRTKGIRQVVYKLLGLKNETQVAGLIEEQYERILSEKTYSEDEVELIKKAYETGFHFEQEHGGCAQCTVAAMYETMEKEKDILFQAATTLAGGGALCTNGSCGAYGGGLLVIGSKIGRSFEGMIAYGDNEERDKAYEMGQKLHDRFVKCYGGVCCRDVQTTVIGRVYYLRDEQEHNKCPGSDGDKCPSVVGYTCSWVTQILIDENMI